MRAPLLAIAAITATATLALPALSGSHGGDLPASVKARKAHMQLNGHNIGVVVRMARGDTEYDADAATAAASNLAALAQLDQRTYWEPGTDSESLEASRALPAIWENMPDVMAKADALAEATTALAASAGDGLDALRVGLGPVGEACSACHDDYQKPNE